MSQTSERDPLEEVAESFLARLRTGERPPLSDYLQRYPHLAEEIREFFPALVMMEQLGPMPSSPAAPPLGSGHPTQLGDYRILREIGRGGMGVVYEAVQESLGRHVALKVLPSSHGDNPMRLERFRREARAAAALHHSHVVPVFGVGEDQGVHYYAMQYIVGHSLAVVLQDVKTLREPGSAGPTSDATLPNRRRPASSPVSPSEAQTGRESVGLLDGSTDGVLGAAYFRSVARVGAQAARALEYAHQQGVLHRDVKPANLLLDGQGTVWLSDFGLAKLESADELTDTGDVVGTLRYLAPERFGNKADARSDVYALALTLYEMATLRPAFVAADRLELIEQIKHGVTARPRQVEPAMPRDLETIILKGCDREPGGRYQSAGEMAEELEAFLADRPIKARPLAWWQQVAKWARRRPGVASLLGMLLLTFVIGLTASLWGWWEADQGRAGERTQRRKTDEALEAEKVQREKADKAFADEKVQREKTDKALEETKTHLYQRNVSLADLHWWGNRVSQARRLLDDCPRDRREWEWHHLDRRCRANLLHFEQPGCRHVRFSPDGKRLALFLTAERDQHVLSTQPRISLHDARTGRLERVRTFEGVAILAEAGERLFLITRTAQQTTLWDVWNGKKLQTFPTKHVTIVHPDGKHVGGQLPGNGAFEVYEIDSGKLIRTVAMPNATSEVRGYAPDGKGLIVWNRGVKVERLQLIDSVTGKQVKSLATEISDSNLAASRAGTEWAVWGSSPSFRLLPDRAGVKASVFTGQQSNVNLVVFGPNPARLASAGSDGRVITWDRATAREHLQFRGHDALVCDVTFDPTSDRVASCDFRGKVFVWDARNGQDCQVREYPGFFHPRMNPDGRSVACTSVTALHLLDPETRRELIPPVPLLRPRLPEHPFSSAGNRLAVWVGGRTQIRDTATGQLIRTIPHEGRLALSPDGNRVALIDARKSAIDLLDVTTGRVVSTLANPGHVPHPVCFAPTGVIAAGESDRDVCVWNPDTNERQRLTLPSKPTAVCFAPDSKGLAIGLADGCVQLWDWQAGRMVRLLQRHDSPVRHLSFHPGGRRLVSGTEASVKIWDVERGQEMLELPLPDRGVVRQLLFVKEELIAGGIGPGKLLRWSGTPVKAD